MLPPLQSLECEQMNASRFLLSRPNRRRFGRGGHAPAPAVLGNAPENRVLSEEEPDPENGQTGAGRGAAARRRDATAIKYYNVLNIIK